jgi:hypothetical protein
MPLDPNGGGALDTRIEQLQKRLRQPIIPVRARRAEIVDRIL